MRIRLLAFAVLMAVAMALFTPAAVSAKNWNTTYAVTEHGHQVGNPQAEITLASFISYTCPHCATFEKSADAPLRLGFIGLGKVRLEVRPQIRNPIDLAAALLAECGPKEKFFDNHRAIMFAQDKWLPIAERASSFQRQRWSYGPVPARMRAIAADLGFYTIMDRRGFSRSATDRCLSNETRAAQIAADSAAESARYAIPGTPSFLLNGRLLENVHDWAGVENALNANLGSGTGKAS